MSSVPFQSIPRPPLIPRYLQQGYDSTSMRLRREWLEQATGCHLDRIGNSSGPLDRKKGNIENPIGFAEVPLGVAGPLQVNGLHAQGVFYVPLATTEGALVRSYERGMVVLTRAGGVDCRIHADENCIAPTFFFRDVIESYNFTCEIQNHLPEIQQEAEVTTRHGKLLRIEPHLVGRNVIVRFHYYTADAHGMNMIAKATDHACRWIARRFGARNFQIFSGFESEKRASGALFNAGKGKRVTAGALLPADLLRRYLRASPEQFLSLWHQTVVGHMQAHAVGYNGHISNGLAAIFIACGQDVANLPNCSVGMTDFELTESGDLYASVTLPSLTVGTVGGGTGLGTARECLSLLHCDGPGYAPKLAEITTAALLAGELSIGAAIISGEFVAAHESYGRNRPEETTSVSERK